jgi:chromate reductase
LRARIKRADAVLFATPEYNRSIPAVLKNVIDIGSRPVGANSWAGKPAAIMSVSPGVMGAFGANQHLRQSISSLNVPLMPSPEAYIGGVTKLLDPAGQLATPTAEFLDKFLASFESWIRRIKA